MDRRKNHTDYHPRWYRQRVSTYWWLERWAYMRFVLREMSSVFVALFVILTLIQIRAVQQGPAAYEALQEWLRSPWLLALNGVTLFFAVFHTVTWFNLAPRALVVRVRGKRVPDLWIAAPNYLAWLAVSAAVAWVLLRG
jgi:fumarate reductase subunit C